MITRLVMTIANVSTPHQNPIRFALQCPQDMVGGYGCRAHDPDRKDIGGILKPGDTGQISRPIGAPITHKGNDCGFEYICFQEKSPFIRRSAHF